MVGRVLLRPEPFDKTRTFTPINLKKTVQPMGYTAVGGPTKKRNKKRNQAGLHWMVHQAQKSGVKMKDVPVNYIVIKEN